MYTGMYIIQKLLYRKYCGNAAYTIEKHHSKKRFTIVKNDIP